MSKSDSAWPHASAAAHCAKRADIGIAATTAASHDSSNEKNSINEKPPAVSCRGFSLKTYQTIRIRSYAERER